MTDLLDDKIRSLMVQVAEAAPPADAIEEKMELRLNTELVPPVVPLRPGLELRPRRGWLVALGAAAAVVVVVGSVAWLFRSTGPDTSVATTPQIDSLSSLTWSRVPHDEAVFGGPLKQSMFDVTAGGPGLVAVGMEEWPDIGTPSAPAPNVVVWTSVDGITWSRVPHNEAVFGGASISSVTVGGPGLVAVGNSGRSAAVWTSPDGITWSRVPRDEAVFGGGSMSSVTVGGPGLVAVGTDGDGQTNPSVSITNAVVWTSPDGIAWSRVPHDEAVFGGGEVGDFASIGGVTVGGPGLVAWGGAWSGVDDPEGGAAMWTSPDGFTWSRVPYDEAVFGGAGISSVTSGGPGLVAVGGVGEDAAVWTSVDGITWSRVRHDEAVFGGDASNWISSVSAAGAGIVAVGSAGEDAAVWTSPDGVTWSRVPPDEAIFGGRPDAGMSTVIADGPGLVAVGSSGWEGDNDATVWIARVE